MRGVILTVLFLFVCAPFVGAQQQNFPGGSSSGGGAGPTISATTYGASSSLQDNNTAFTAASAAFNAASLTAGNPTVKLSTQATCASCSSLNPTIAISPGDTVLVFPLQINIGRTVTITDTGGNTYGLLIPYVSSNGTVQTWGTAPSGAVNSATSLTINISGAAANQNVIVVTLSNVGSYRFLRTYNANGASTAPSLAQTVADANNIFISSYSWFNGSVSSASQNSGTLLQTFPSGASVGGGAVVAQSGASVGTALTNSITLNTSNSWVTEGMELRSRTAALPTLYITNGTYLYSGGLSFTQPGTLRCEPGTVLYYTGAAHAVDLGSTLVNATLNSYPIGVDGCEFQGGANMTDGLVFHDNNVSNFVRNSTFHNFGNPSGNSHAIVGTCENWDMEIGPQNRYLLSDNIFRPVFINNQTGCSANSFARFHDSYFWCYQGDNPSVNCSSTLSGVGIIMDGSQNRFYHNNGASGWSTLVRFACTNSPCYGNQADQNMIEAPGDGGAGTTFQFSGTQNGLLITQNVTNMHGNTGGLVGPVGGTDVLAGARINFNTLTNMPLATPVVKQNNVTGQTANYSYMNECSTTLSTLLPCALMHTTGGNISQWNGDQWPQITFSAATSASYTFQQTYNSAPKCGQPVAVSPGTTTFTITTLNTTTLTVTASASFTGTVTVPCSSSDGQ